MDSYYNNITNYNELYGDEQRKKISLIKKIFGNQEKVLDVGCGTLLSKEFFPNIIGIDPSEKLLPKEGIVGSAEHLPFPDKTFDLVICVTVLQNVHDKEKALQEIQRVSKGKVVVTLLKKSPHFATMKKLVIKYFPNMKELEEEKDLILYQS